MRMNVLLCDHAQVAGNKLFISGANIDRMLFPPNSQAPYFLNFAAAGVVHVPWTATNAEHILSFKLETEDGQEPPLPPDIQNQKAGVGGQMVFNLGRPPQLASGEEQMLPFAFNFQGLPLMRSGRYVLIFLVDGSEMSRLTFTLIVEPSPGFQRSQ